MKNYLKVVFIFLSPFFLTLSISFSNEKFETVPEGESQEINSILKTISKQIEDEFKEKGFALRDAHAKQHGCVKAQVEIKSSLSKKYQSSVFIPGKKYKAWVRYSNGSGKSQDDSVGDGRGMALKIIGTGDAGYQDFLMINHPVFFVRNVSDYVSFTETVARNGNPIKFFIPGINPFAWRVHEMMIGRAIQAKKVNQLLNTQYWTMTPFEFNDQAAKFNVRPCKALDMSNIQKSGKDFLRINLSKELTHNDSCFILSAQFFKNQKTTPIEDPTIEWLESNSPSIDLARVIIPSQKFDSQKQMDFCENLSFTPWNFSSEHKPLGGINRARKAIYDGISQLRHELNKTLIPEPTGDEEFNELPI